MFRIMGDQRSSEYQMRSRYQSETKYEYNHGRGSPFLSYLCRSRESPDVRQSFFKVFFIHCPHTCTNQSLQFIPFRIWLRSFTVMLMITKRVSTLYILYALFITYFSLPFLYKEQEHDNEGNMGMICLIQSVQIIICVDIVHQFGKGACQSKITCVFRVGFDDGMFRCLDPECAA